MPEGSFDAIGLIPNGPGRAHAHPTHETTIISANQADLNDMIVLEITDSENQYIEPVVYARGNNVEDSNTETYLSAISTRMNNGGVRSFGPANEENLIRHLLSSFSLFANTLPENTEQPITVLDKNEIETQLFSVSPEIPLEKPTGI